MVADGEDDARGVSRQSTATDQRCSINRSTANASTPARTSPKLQATEGQPQLPGTPMDLTFFGSGFFYQSEEEEIDSLRQGHKVATSVDMMTIAVSTRGTTALAVSTLSELVAKLGQSAGPIRRVRILGHSNGDELALGGSINTLTNELTWKPINSISKQTIEINRRFISEVTAKRFTKDAEIWLYGCNSGDYRLGGLAQATADAFGVPVRGFRTALDVCVGLKTEGGKAYRISDRGWFRIAGKFKNTQSCAAQGFVRDLSRLVPKVPFKPLTGKK